MYTALRAAAVDTRDAADSRSADSSGSGDPDTVRLLREASSGHRGSLDRLVPVVYQELRDIARRQLRREASDHTLDSVALVNEAYLKLVGHERLDWENRAHFRAIAARAMRTILVDHARARKTQKRGGGAVPITLSRVAGLATPDDTDRFLALNEALERLREVDEEACRTVECRYFADLSLEEVAEVLDRSVATVGRRWAFAKAWLRRELSESPG